MRIQDDKIRQILTELETDIGVKYSGKKKERKAGLLALRFCGEWAFAQGVWEDKEISKVKCKEYVKFRIKEESRYGSLITMILVSVIAKLIAEWIINRFFDKIYDEG